MQSSQLKKYITKQAHIVLALLILFIGLPVNYVIWDSETKNADNELALKFQYLIKNAEVSIGHHLGSYKQTLISMQSFYHASNYVDPSEFNLFATRLTAHQKNSSLKEIGYAKYVNTQMRSKLKDFNNDKAFLSKIYPKPNTTSKEFAPIEYLYANSDLKLSNLHFDLFSNPDIKQEMHDALRLNDVVMSSSLRMNDDEIKQCYCFNLYIPVFNGLAHLSTISQRKSNLIGWAYLTFSGEDLLSEVFSSGDSGQLGLTVADVNHHQPNIIFYKNKTISQIPSSYKPKFTKQLIISTMQHQWMLNVSSTPEFDASVNYHRANKIGFLGLTATLLFAATIYLIGLRLRSLVQMQEVSHALSLSEQRWQFALEGSGDGIWDWDIVNNSVMLSKRWKAMLGYAEDELENSFDTCKKLIHPEDYSTVLEAIEISLSHATVGEKNTFKCEYRILCKDNSWKWILDRGMVVSRNLAGEALRMVGTTTDISMLKQSEETIWQHANFDSLTSLPNRRMFYARLDQEIQKLKRTGLQLALIFFDLDDFKAINDTLGHDQGDMLLKLASCRLTEIIRESDMVARLGGDEFILLISDIEIQNLSSIEVIAKKVLDSMAQPFQLSYEKAYVSASLGISIFPDDALRQEDLMKCVDQAMYASKQKGGACFTYFTPLMQKKAQYHMQISNDLRGALSRNELFLEYQPIVELASGEIYKAEALIRWQHPTRGLVSPAEFIPIAEDTRLINEIGNWVFNQAILQAIEWRKTIDQRFQIAVNKSPLQFRAEPGVSTWINGIQNRAISGDFVVVEITESLLLDATQKVVERLALFQRLGVQVALDDFGTGYSSLSYLKKFDIDYIKIDQSFVANIALESSDLAICEAMIVMAHRLGIKVIAEGIETQLQQELLTKAGCDYGQGYYFSKSIKPSEFEAFVKVT